MNKKEIMILVMRLAGIYCWLQAFNYLSVFISSAHMFQSCHEEEVLVVYILLANFLGLLLLGLFLFFSSWVRKIILPTINEDISSKSMKSSEMQAVAFSVVGALVLINGLPALASSIATLISYHEGTNQPYVTYFNSRFIGNVTAQTVKVVLGLYLFFGARGLVGIWHKLQKVGLDKNSGEVAR